MRKLIREDFIMSGMGVVLGFKRGLRCGWFSLLQSSLLELLKLMQLQTDLKMEKQCIRTRLVNRIFNFVLIGCWRNTALQCTEPYKAVPRHDPSKQILQLDVILTNVKSVKTRLFRSVVRGSCRDSNCNGRHNEKQKHE